MSRLIGTFASRQDPRHCGKNLAPCPLAAKPTSLTGHQYRRRRARSRDRQVLDNAGEPPRGVHGLAATPRVPYQITRVTAATTPGRRAPVHPTIAPVTTTAVSSRQGPRVAAGDRLGPEAVEGHQDHPDRGHGDPEAERQGRAGGGEEDGRQHRDRGGIAEEARPPPLPAAGPQPAEVGSPPQTATVTTAATSRVPMARVAASTREKAPEGRHRERDRLEGGAQLGRVDEPVVEGEGPAGDGAEGGHPDDRAQRARPPRAGGRPPPRRPPPRGPRG